MLAPKKMMYDKAGPKVVEMLNRRHFEAFYCANGTEAVEKALSLIPVTDTVSWGGVMTADELGIKDKLIARGNPVIDRTTGKNEDEQMELMRNALCCDTFLMSANAISADGQLVNIDGNGNRVAALCFGPKSVVVIAGMNKVMPTLEDAVSRARNVAAPANEQRFMGKVPCAVTGQCSDCISPECICANMVITRVSRPVGKIKVILVGEELGL